MESIIRYVIWKMISFWCVAKKFLTLTGNEDPENIVTLSYEKITAKVAVLVDRTWPKRRDTSCIAIILIYIKIGEILNFVMRGLFWHILTLVVLILGIALHFDFSTSFRNKPSTNVTQLCTQKIKYNFSKLLWNFDCTTFTRKIAEKRRRTWK